MDLYIGPHAGGPRLIRMPVLAALGRAVGAVEKRTEQVATSGDQTE